jgi:adenine-specific DNA-methyltransferase
MNEIFGKENFRNEIDIKRNQSLPKTGDVNLVEETENLFVFSKSEKFHFLNQLVERDEAEWVELGTRPSDAEINPPRVIEGKEFYPPKYRRWAYSQENLDEMYTKGRLKVENGKIKILLDKRKLGSNWTDIPGYSTVPIWGFKTENSEILLKRVIESTSNENDLVMDFFLGSGTTTAVAHKLRRKWIGIEMGEHFWTVIMPRMKKVLAYDKSGISKEKDVKEKYNEKTAGGFFKYQILEQYEDTLDNIELQENQSVKKLFKDDYLIKYFLDYETRESPYLLNFQHLKNPFNYKLKINLSEVGEPQETNIDIPETFNYLLGIKIKKIKKEQNEGKTYLFIIGEKDSKDYAIVWREHADNWNEEDYKKDKEFIKQQLKPYKPQVVYVNCSSILTPNFDDYKAEIRYIEPEFKALMES